MGRSSRIAELYSQHNQARGRDYVYGGEERTRQLRHLLPAQPCIALDVGCRDGALAEALGLDRATTVGVDIDPAALKRARDLGRLRPVVCDLWTGLPFASESFDLVVAGEVLEHLPFPHMLVAECRPVLRPGGVLIGSVPNSFRLKNRLRFLAGRPFEADPTHLRQFSPSMLRELLGHFFSNVWVTPCVGRWTWLAPRLMANDLVFWCR